MSAVSGQNNVGPDSISMERNRKLTFRNVGESQHRALYLLFKCAALMGRSDFIDRVVIGPSPNKDLSHTAVDLFFRKQKLRVEVVSSAVPYREW